MMFKNDHKLSTVTAVLPTAASRQVADAVTADKGTNALVWQARGTLLHDHWLKRWVPPISPAKSLLQMIVPDSQVDRLVSTVVEHGKLNYQATGAVFSTPCEHVYLGTEFHTWPGEESASPSNEHALHENLSVIYCIVGHQLSDRVSRAAINAGAHGPIVYYSEGRGLRDRLGWLRITKEHEKEVLMVICDENDVEDVFDAMAKAGELHLPGHGFMYRLSIDKGMFNLPSRVSHHHYAANMQQIIHTIDHLAGHTHWRDQSVFNVGGNGRGVGLEFLAKEQSALPNQMCLSAVVRRDHMQGLMDLMLDNGAPGLNFTYARYRDFEEASHLSGPQIHHEYAVLRAVTNEACATQICGEIDAHAEPSGVRDLCVMVSPVARVATYVRSAIDYRADDHAA
jgi:nitrogen regulatory protein PII